MNYRDKKRGRCERAEVAASADEPVDFPQIRASITKCLAYVVQLNQTKFRLVKHRDLARYHIENQTGYRDVTKDCEEIDCLVQSRKRREWEYRYVSWCYIAKSCGIVAAIFSVRGELYERVLFRSHLAKIAPNVQPPLETIFQGRNQYTNALRRNPTALHEGQQHRGAQEAYIHALPAELLGKIFEYVYRGTQADNNCEVDDGKREQLLGAALTCKKWYQTSQLFLWRTLRCGSEAVRSNRLRSTTILRVLRSTERGINVKRLTLNSFTMSQKFNWSMLPNLAALSVEVDFRSGYNTITDLSNLKSLDVSIVGLCQHHRTLLFDFTSLPVVEKIDVGCLAWDQPILSMRGGFQKLRSISLTNFSFNDSVDTMFKSAASTLECLFLYGCKGPKVLNVHFPSLKHLKISRMPQKMTYPNITKVSYWNRREVENLRKALINIRLGLA